MTKRREPTIVEETALATAQARIQNAMDRSKVTKAELARRMEVSPSYITRIMSGEHNLTIKTLARALHECGFRALIDIRREAR